MTNLRYLHSPVLNDSFEILARLITVRDLSQPLFDSFEVSEPVAEVFERWIEDCGEHGQDPMEQIALVTDNGRVVGWVGFDMLTAGKSIGECADRIRPDAILTADTPGIEAAKSIRHVEEYLDGERSVHGSPPRSPAKPGTAH